jgi:hypothetical protein
MAIEEAHLVLTIFTLKVILITRQAVVLGAFVLRRFYGIFVPEDHDFPIAWTLRRPRLLGSLPHLLIVTYLRTLHLNCLQISLDYRCKNSGHLYGN